MSKKSQLVKLKKQTSEAAAQWSYKKAELAHFQGVRIYSAKLGRKTIMTGTMDEIIRSAHDITKLTLHERR